MQFIDIHGHYAWKIDSHITSRDDAIKLLTKVNVQDMIAIVASPRMICGKEDLQEIYDRRKRIEELRLLAAHYNIHVYEGSELIINDHLAENIKQKLIVPIERTRYLLCSFDNSVWTHKQMQIALRALMNAHYKPILTRTESYITSSEDLDFFRHLHQEGVILQVNTSSLLGAQGPSIRKLAHHLLTEGIIAVIATDTHHYEGDFAPNMKDAYAVLAKSFDYQTLKTLMYDNPLAIISNEAVKDIPKRKNGLFALFNRK